MRLFEDYIALVGRILIALALIKFGTDKIRNWDQVYEWIRYTQIPLPALVLGLANTIEVVGAVLLIIGFKTRWAALVIALYLIPVHLVIHNFWAVDPSERASQIEHFGKGMMIIGGLLFVFLHGGGAISVDARWFGKSTPKHQGPPTVSSRNV
jgi:putative oxidoreductase